MKSLCINSRVREWLLLFWCGLLGINASAQLPQFQLSRILEQEGLSTAEVIGMEKDNSGYLWIATQGKLQRFDGKHTQTYAFNETIFNLFIDKQSRVWITTTSRVYMLAPGIRLFEKVEMPGEQGEVPLRIFERADGSIALISSQKLWKYNQLQCRFVVEKIQPHTHGEIYLRPFAQSGQSAYFSSSQGISRFYPESDEVQFIPIKALHSLLSIGEAGIIVSSYLFKSYWLDNKHGALIQINTTAGKAGASLLINHAVPFAGNQYLLSTNQGLLFFDVNTKQCTKPVFYYKGEPLRDPASAKYLYRSSDGIVYICHADGIYFLEPQRKTIQYIRNYQFGTKRLPDNDVRSFTEDESGNIWMATTLGIARLNPFSGEINTYGTFDDPEVPTFQAFRYVLNQGSFIWIGTSGHGVWLLHKYTGRYHSLNFTQDSIGASTRQLMQEAYVWKILPLQDGRFLVVCSRQCFFIDPETRLCTLANFASSNESSRSAWQDKAGRIWHGTANGLTCLTKDFKLLFHIQDSFPDLRIAALYENGPNKMLVGSKGLFQATMDANDRLVKFERVNAIPAIRFIYCLNGDRQGRIWLGTDDGIYRYDPKAQTAVRFDASDHVQSQAFSSNGAFLSSSGTLYMGGHNGINYFDPATIEPVKQALLPAITEFIVQGADINLPDSTATLNLANHQRNIAFTISVPYYKNPFELQYRYSLYKNSNEWVDNGFLERVSIKNLSAGNYNLRVAVSTDGKQWTEGIQSISFTVLKPWWRTHVFIAFVIVLLTAIAWFIKWKRLRNREALEMEKAIQYFALSGQPNKDSISILWDIARNCISRLGFEDCVIYLVDNNRKVLIQKAAYGPKSPDGLEIANPIEIPIGQGITGYAALHATTELVADTSKDNRYILDKEMGLSEMAVPIIHENRVIGIIDSEHSKRNFFKPRHRKTVEQIAAICSSKIAHSLALEAMQHAEAKLAELNTRMMESRFMNLRLQMNPHFLFNTLTSIQYLVVSGQTAKASKYLNVFSGFLRAMLQFAEVNVVTLQDELRILVMYVELESLTMDETFLYEIVIADDVEPDESWVPFMLLQPFVENAILHGLQHRVGEKKFKILVSSNDDENIVCIIEDNGVGRVRSAEINAAKMRNALHESKGISIVKQRLALLQEKTGKAGGVIYEDLYDEQGNPTGTRVTITIPYFNNNEL